MQPDDPFPMDDKIKEGAPPPPPPDLLPENLFRFRSGGLRIFRSAKPWREAPVGGDLQSALKGLGAPNGSKILAFRARC